MSCDCEDKTITIYQGFPTYWNGKSLIDVSFESGIDLTNFSAIFKVLNIEKTYTDIAEGFSIDLTKQETAQLPVGLNYGELIIIDNESHKRPFTTALPLNVENWVSGDIHLDNYKLIVNTKIKDNKLVIKVETNKIDESIIRNLISEHNQDENAHPYILNTKQDKLTSENAGDGIAITDVGGIVKIENIDPDKSFIFEQGISSDVWEIQHNLDKYPAISIVDTAGNEIIANIQYINRNNVKITMTSAFKGKAYLN